jgi:hypothetical protein
MLREFLDSHRGEDVLLYSAGSAGDCSGAEAAAIALENTMADLAVYAARIGWKKIVVAGGETSGAVTQALGFTSFLIGPSIEPGVPEMTPVEIPIFASCSNPAISARRNSFSTRSSERLAGTR